MAVSRILLALRRRRRGGASIRRSEQRRPRRAASPAVAATLVLGWGAAVFGCGTASPLAGGDVEDGDRADAAWDDAAWDDAASAAEGGEAELDGTGHDSADRLICPELAGLLAIEGHAQSVTVSGALAAVAAREGGVRFVDVTDPTEPTEVGSYHVGEAARVAVERDIAYVATWGGGVSLLNVADPSRTRPIGGFDTGGHAWWVSIRSNRAYVADSVTGVHVVDLSGAAGFREIGTWSGAGEEMAVEARDALVVVASGSMGVHVVLDEGTSGFVQLAHVDTMDYARSLVLDGNRAFVADSLGGVRVIALDDPANPREVGSLSAPGLVVEDLALSGTLLVLAAGPSGMIFADVGVAGDPVVVGTFDTSAIPARSVHGVALDGTAAYAVASDDEVSNFVVLSLQCR